MPSWELGEAERRLGQLIEAARTDGPQIITLNGVELAAVLSVDDFRAPTAHKPGLSEYLLGGPRVDDFEIERDRDTGREISL